MFIVVPININYRLAVITEERKVTMLTDKFKVPIEIKFENFTKYVRRQKIARFLTQHEIFKKQTQIKGR